MAKIEFDEQMVEGEKTLFELKQQFYQTLQKKLAESNEEKEINFESLRPNFGHPSKKDHLQTIDDREKHRQEDLQTTVTELRSNTMVDPCTSIEWNILFSFLGRIKNQYASNY